MNHSSNRRGLAVRLRAFPKQPLTVACASILLALAQTAPAADATLAAPVDGAQDQQQSTSANGQAQASKPKTGQDAADTLNTITVTGIAGSLQTASRVKQNSDAIVEVVAAEDIGKLPDISIAESLSRLPGLTTQRGDGGQANLISIRGTTPDFVGTTLNGREQATTGENRAVNFDQYPAELISGAVVYKTPQADLIGQGLSGTIDLHTLHPLDLKDRQVVFNLRGSHNTNGDLQPGDDVGANGRRATASYVDQFFDHTLGVALGVSQIDLPVQEQQFKAGYFTPANDYPNYPAQHCPGSVAPWASATTIPGAPVCTFTQNYAVNSDKSESELRNSVIGALEWAPNDNYHSMLDIYYSKLKQESYTNGLEWSSAPWDGISLSNPAVSPGFVSYDHTGVYYPLVTSGTYHGITPIGQNKYNNERDYLFSIGWNNRLKLANDWQIDADLSYSRASNKVRDIQLYGGLVPGKTDLQFQLPSGSGLPTYTIPVDLGSANNFVLGDPGNYGRNGREEFDHQKDEIKAFRIEAEHPLGWIFNDIKFGFSYSEREKTKAADVFYAYLNGNGCSSAYTQPIPGTSIPAINPQCQNSNYMSSYVAALNSGTASGLTSLGFVGLPGFTNYNALQAIANQYYLEPVNSYNDLNRNYTVKEKIPLAYVMLNIDTALGDIPVRGNVGAQFVRTEQSSVAQQIAGGSAPVGALSGSETYNKFLPSLNLVFDMSDGMLVRFALAKEMARGRIDDEKIAQQASLSQCNQNPLPSPLCSSISPADRYKYGVWSGDGGNYRLKPYVAVGTDLSFEKYFGEISYTALTLFNKNLLNYVYTQIDVNHNFSNVVNTSYAQDPACTNDPKQTSCPYYQVTPVSPTGSYTQPANGAGGRMQGVELSAQIEGALFSKALDGFGMHAGFAFVNSFLPSNTFSSINNPVGDPVTALPGLSKKSGDIGIFYEKNGFSIRIDQNYRSSYIGEFTVSFGQLGYDKIRGHTQTDFQAGYEFSEGRAKGLSLLLQVFNLNNSPDLVDFHYQTLPFNSSGSTISFYQPQRYNVAGRTIFVGLNYKL